jgi:hypothetical protein
MTDRKVAAAKHLAAGAGSDDPRQTILCSECSDDLAGAQRMLVHEHHNPPVEWLLPQAFSHETNRAIAVEHQ